MQSHCRGDGVFFTWDASLEINTTHTIVFATWYKQFCSNALERSRKGNYAVTACPFLPTVNDAKVHRSVIWWRKCVAKQNLYSNTCFWCQGITKVTIRLWQQHTSAGHFVPSLQKWLNVCPLHDAKQKKTNLWAGNAGKKKQGRDRSFGGGGGKRRRTTQHWHIRL